MEAEAHFSVPIAKKYKNKTMETIDLVDENDKVIGATNKMEAHEKGYCHRVSAVYLFTPENKLLVQLRKKDGLLDNSVGGHVKQGEAYINAATREMKEEVGIVKSLDEVGIFYSDERVLVRKSNIVHYFGLYETKLSKKEMEEIVLAEDEVTDLIPMTLEEVAMGMTEKSKLYAVGFMRTFNFYAQKRKLPIKPIKI